MSFDPAVHVTKIAGKDYLEVKWRLVWFRKEFPHGLITTDEMVVDLDAGYARFRATVNDGEGGVATGTGTEWRTNMPKGMGDDFVEKAETRAIGRALAVLGLGTQFVGEELSENRHIVDSPVTPEVKKAMDRFHAKDAEVKAGSKSPEQHELRRVADEEEQTSGVKAFQEPSSPFVPAGKTPGGTPSTASASPSTPPHEATASAPERKPRQPKPKADRPPGVMYQMNTKQLLQAIQGQFTRLCGTDKDAMRDICRHAFGSLVSTWQGVTELSDQDLRLGLATLEPMVKEEPPAVPTDSAGVSGQPRSEDASSHAQDVSVESTPASGSTFTDMTNASEEDVHSFPPSDGNPQEGPQEPPGDTQSNQSRNGITQAGKVDSNEQQVTLPDAPDIVDGYVSFSHVDVLESWAMMYGQHDCFVEMTMGCTREAGKICLTPRLYERIIMAVQYRAAHAEAKA